VLQAPSHLSFFTSSSQQWRLFYVLTTEIRLFPTVQPTARIAVSPWTGQLPPLLPLPTAHFRRRTSLNDEKCAIRVQAPQ